MRVVATRLPGVLVVEPELHRDERGTLLETYHRERYARAGLDVDFVQDTCSRSRQGTLRGLHHQSGAPQGKLVMALHGSVFDVAVDIRRGSPHFGEWVALELSAETGRQLWIPPGFAHGFCVTSEHAVVAYKCTAFYVASAQHAVAWDDPDLGIRWPVATPVLSVRDAAAPRLRQADWLPDYHEPTGSR